MSSTKVSSRPYYLTRHLGNICLTHRYHTLGLNIAILHYCASLVFSTRFPICRAPIACPAIVLCCLAATLSYQAEKLWTILLSHYSSALHSNFTVKFDPVFLFD